jgi:hypothetical protein
MSRSPAFLLRFGSSYAENEIIWERSVFPLRLDGISLSLLHAPKNGAKWILYQLQNSFLAFHRRTSSDNYGELAIITHL